MGKNQGARKGTVVHLAHLVANDKAHIPDRPQERAPDDSGFFSRGLPLPRVLRGRRAIGRPLVQRVMMIGDAAAAAAVVLAAAAVTARDRGGTAAAAAYGVRRRWATAAARPAASGRG